MMPIAHCHVTAGDFQDWLKANPDISPNATYNEWTERLEKFSQDIASRGGSVVKVYVRPSEFINWCSDHGAEVNANARARYAAERIAVINRDGIG